MENLMIALVITLLMQVSLAAKSNGTKCEDSHPQCRRLCASKCINPAINSRGPTCKDFFGGAYELLEVFCPKSCNACAKVNQTQDKVDKFMISSCGKPSSGMAALVGDTSKSCGVQTRYRAMDTSGPYAGKAVYRLCFPQSGYETEKAWAMEAAQKWMDESCSNLVLLRGDDKNCDEKMDGVVPTKFVSTGPETRYSVASPNDGGACLFREYEIDLNADFKTWSPDSGCTENENVRKNCIVNNAMHEIGHLFGFGHEHDHGDSNCEDKTGSERPVEITEYDPESIMNYCNEKRWQDPKLSAADIRGAQQVYGSTC